MQNDKNQLNKIGIQGGKGSFNEQAARFETSEKRIKKFDLVYLHTTERVLTALDRGDITIGQFAIHNSTGGIVDESIDAMGFHLFKITEKSAIKIEHTLMCRKDSSLEEIDTIMTHPQVLKQCKRNLEIKYPNLKQTSGDGDLIDHAKVAEMLSKNEIEKNIATMGSKVLAEIYGLKILEEGLQDLEENWTSFLWVKK